MTTCRSRIFQYQTRPARVLAEKARHIVHLALDNYPARFRRRVLRHLDWIHGSLQHAVLQDQAAEPPIFASMERAMYRSRLMMVRETRVGKFSLVSFGADRSKAEGFRMEPGASPGDAVAHGTRITNNIVANFCLQIGESKIISIGTSRFVSSMRV